MINGNIKSVIKIKTNSLTDEIGQQVIEYKEIKQINGWLDFCSGKADNSYNALIQKSTHLFICDYFNFKKLGIDSNNSIMVINNKKYTVNMIDNPMGLNQHLEFYLEYLGVEDDERNWI